MKKKLNYLILLFTLTFMVGCTEGEDAAISDETKSQVETTVNTSDLDEKPVEETDPEKATADTNNENEEAATTAADEAIAEEISDETNDEQFSGYKLIEVDGGDLSGHREPKVAVDIGYGDREYWAFTNEHGQLVRVIADEIILQDDSSEPVTSNGRYYNDEAKVPGVESDTLDEGHVIADSLGGVSNAYNITPQDSTLNRHGDQAYMEKVIRDAGGVTDFEAIITYPNTETQTPSSYQYTYTLMGNEVVDKFDNVNPDQVNESLGLTDSKTTSETSEPTGSTTNGDISSIDTNGNGQVTIKEAKAAGFSMPITSDHWLYPYMRDNDGDGMVGE
ncbi:DNA/RNA non-specific endonuclease [Bhargavaea cecembensis]|uniref:DNA/RNA non-specific endonuclease n=1 Tax=Bhargavaea cecembensis TaxID=394098 RepID=UPI00058E6596|nr:DNA/RNA non-specific endonuclease [Bhargavaea cecembensis]